MDEVTNTGLVDFHCHLDLYPDHEAAFRDAEAARVFTLAVTTTPRAWRRNVQLAEGLRYVRPALGLHPQLVADHADELPLWTSLLKETRYVGEVGLDGGPKYFRSLDLQKEVFRHVLRECAAAGGKVLTVHSLRAVAAVLDHIDTFLPRDRGTVVLHWFTGSRSEARRAIDLGCYFSVNAAMLANDRHRDLISTLPLDRVLTETDGPFTRSGPRQAVPADVASAVGALAQLRGMTPEAMARTVNANLRALVQ